MDNNQPGLQPRKLEGEVGIDPVSEARLQAEVDRSGEKPATEQVTQQPVSENTEAKETVEPTGGEEQVSNRAQERIQTLDKRAKDAEQRAAYFEQMARNMVNAPAQPTQSQDELLAKQFSSYDAKQGYPTDPGEYARFVQIKAADAARQEAIKQNQQVSERQEASDLLKSYPDALQDPAFMGAITGLKQSATNQGQYLSLKDAADFYNSQVERKASKKVADTVAQTEADKNAAYVETTRGASTNRAVGSPVNPDTMTLDEMETFLKDKGEW